MLGQAQNNILLLSKKLLKKEGDSGMSFVEARAVNQYTQRFKILFLSYFYQTLIKI